MGSDGPQSDYYQSNPRSRNRSIGLFINDLTVYQAAQGLASYRLKKQQEQQSNLPQWNQKLYVAVGYDHRSHPTLNILSLSFATILTAIVFAEARIDCILFHTFIMTPLVPFCIQELSAVCGVMVTASHNPHQDNSYNVYTTPMLAIDSFAHW